MMLYLRLVLTILVTLGTIGVHAFDNSRTDNVAVYWGQNSYGATNPSATSKWQQTLSYYCQDDSIDVFPLAFLHIFFSTGGLPSLDLSSTCSGAGNGVFAGTALPNCGFLASDIKACQAKGKIITLSLGGATGSTTFASTAQARGFADTVWNLFLGGQSATRPFGDAVLDGIDLDVETGGTNGAYFVAFATRLRELYATGGKKYFLTGAPQCPFPDAFLGTVVNAIPFDALYVQFYNNWCGLQNYNNIWAWNFETWDTWAKTVSPNKNVKIYIGAPASASAAGSGYLDVDTLTKYVLETRSKYSSFGGVMFWDASQAYANNRIDRALKNALRTSPATSSSSTTSITTSTSSTTTSSLSTTASTSSSSTSATLTLPTGNVNLSNPTSTSSAASSTTPTSTPTPTASGTVDCSKVKDWSNRSVYFGRSRAIYSGHLWVAKWWSYNDKPGGLAGVWTDRGACLGYDDDDDEDCEDEDDAGTSGAGSLRIARYVDEDEEKEEAEELAPAVPTRTVHRSRWFRF